MKFGTRVRICVASYNILYLYLYQEPGTRRRHVTTARRRTEQPNILNILPLTLTYALTQTEPATPGSLAPSP